ncbi:hypothetical protein BDZ94DRAFT_1294593 [Collybia nuda]|uniref:Expression library immunization antigen 1 n=1 Tax=Collybia nuda TaxID=64659 RepID=A0A9P5YF53_9AGAR|nr:hypothetical protein BDZ94DRAFT_1294593 [Collybia nuda]
MKIFAVAATLISALPAIAALRIETPTNAVQCQPLLLTWSDGKAPFFVSVIPGGQPAAPAVKTFPPQDGNSMTWVVDIARGVSLTMSLKDGTGAQAYSDIFVINDSSDNKCVNSTVQINGSGGAPATAGNTLVGLYSSPAPSGVGATGSSNGTKPTGTGTGAAPSNSNTASKSVVGAFGLAGVMGFVGAVLL